MEGKAVSGMAPVSKTGGAVTRMGIVPSAFRYRENRREDGDAGVGRPLVANQMAPPGVGFDSLAIRSIGPRVRRFCPVAQSEARMALDHEVEGSNPSGAVACKLPTAIGPSTVTRGPAMRVENMAGLGRRGDPDCGAAGSMPCRQPSAASQGLVFSSTIFASMSVGIGIITASQVVGMGMMPV